MPPKIDYTGQKFNRMTAISYSHTLKSHRYWKCKCECGNYTIVQIRAVVSGNTKSCGCYNKEKVQKTGKANKTHGYSTSKIYKLWWSIVQRCNNKKSKMYKDYGAKGIKICEEWLKFDNFLKEMGDRPSNLYTVRRINIDKDYEVSNCKWAIYERNGMLIEYDEKKQTLSKWAEELNVDVGVLYRRVVLKHWSMERAITTPVIKYKKNLTNNN